MSLVANRVLSVLRCAEAVPGEVRSERNVLTVRRWSAAASARPWTSSMPRHYLLYVTRGIVGKENTVRMKLDTKQKK